MPDKEVSIKISAKNLTAAEFKKARQEILGLGRDTKKAGQDAKGLGGNIKSFVSAHASVFKSMAAGAGIFAGAVAGAAAAVVKLGERGSELEAIASSFEKLTSAAGQSGDEMVRVTSSATKGLITDLNIMESANKALLLGLPVTSQSMGNLAQSAVVLGRAMGQDANKSLDDLITALGRSSPMILDNLGLTVKVGEANEAYAAKLGKASSELTDAEKKMAFYEAAVAAATEKVNELGGITLTFGDYIQQGKVLVTNFVDSLSMGVAQSPVFAAGLRSITESMQAAFGGDNQDLITSILTSLEGATMTAIEFGKAGLTVADWIYRSFSGLKVVVYGLQTAFAEVWKQLTGLIASALELASKIPGVGEKFKGVAEDVRFVSDMAGSMSANMKELTVEAAQAAAGQSNFSKTIQATKGALTEVQTEMTNAGSSTKEFAASSDEAKQKSDELGQKSGELGEKTGVLGDKFDQLLDKMEKTKGKSGELKEKYEELGTVTGYLALESEGLLSKIPVATKFEEPRKEAEKFSVSLLDLTAGVQASTVPWVDMQQTLDGVYSRYQVGIPLIRDTANELDNVKGATERAGESFISFGDITANIFIDAFGEGGQGGAIGSIVNGFFGEGGFFSGLISQGLEGILGKFSGFFGEGGGLSGVLTKFFGGGGEGGGGGSFLGSLASTGMGVLSGVMTGGITTLISTLGPLVAKGIGKIAGFFKNLFGGPSADELAGREIVEKFEDNLIQMLNDTQLIEAGGERWKQVNIAIRDAYLAVGKSEEEAMAAAERLSRSSQDGAAASEAAVAEVAAILEEAKKKSEETGISIFNLGRQGKKGAGDAKEAVEDLNAKLEETARKTITIPIRFDVEDLDLPAPGGVRGAQAGGIFSRPAFRVIAEHEPEIVGSPNAIVSALEQAMRRLSFAGGGGGRGDVFIAVDKSGQASMLSRQQFRYLERMMGDGVVRVTQRAVGARTR